MSRGVFRGASSTGKLIIYKDNERYHVREETDLGDKVWGVINKGHGMPNWVMQAVDKAARDRGMKVEIRSMSSAKEE